MKSDGMKCLLLLLMKVGLSSSSSSSSTSSTTSSNTFPSPELKHTENFKSSQPPVQQQSSKLNNLVTLDLAGAFDVHLCSSSKDKDDEMTYATTPLFKWSRKDLPEEDKNMPNVHIGGEYNFKRIWYGLTKATAALSWGSINSRQYNNCDIHAHVQSYTTKIQQDQTQSMSATISTEKGLLSSNDYAINFGVSIPTRKHLIKSTSSGKLPSSAVIRYETINQNHENCPTTSIIVRSTFLHPRIQLVGKSIVKMGESFCGILQSSNKSSNKSSPSSPFQSRVQQRKFNLNDESSWIPDIKMTPSGKVLSESTFGFSPDRRKWNTNRIGVRLMVKKQINWNLLGSIFQQVGNNENSMSSYNDYDDELDNDTNVRLEICGLTGENSLSLLAVDTALERIKESFRCTIAHEGVII